MFKVGDRVKINWAGSYHNTGTIKYINKYNDEYKKTEETQYVVAMEYDGHVVIAEKESELESAPILKKIYYIVNNTYHTILTTSECKDSIKLVLDSCRQKGYDVSDIKSVYVEV